MLDQSIAAIPARPGGTLIPKKTTQLTMCCWLGLYRSTPPPLPAHFASLQIFLTHLLVYKPSLMIYGTTHAPANVDERTKPKLYQRMVASSTTGVLAILLASPADKVKTMLQASSPHHPAASFMCIIRCPLTPCTLHCSSFTSCVPVVCNTGKGS